MTLKIIACEVMKEELLRIPLRQAADYEFVSMGLHLHPDKLRVELQRLLDNAQGYETVILAFGLCGGAVRGIKSPHASLVIPRVHDCIPLLLGSQEAFQHCSAEETGTFYMSCGWILTERNILTEHERVREKFGDKKAAAILARTYSGYKKLLFIHTGCDNDAAVLEQSREMARLLTLDHATTTGDPGYLQQIVNGPWDSPNFIRVPPGEAIEES
ncbi:MAG TPA: DUF1638 domain-containing protein, partial [Patescibacteria group bacterium]|nr:DUF1638 domain-containing protein [Patescibacteria group bacterium]